MSRTRIICDKHKVVLSVCGCSHPAVEIPHSDTPETEAAWDAYYRGAAGLRFVRDKMESFERQRNEAREENARLRSAAVRLYNLGYAAGHHETVEACFTDIHSSDMDTYHSEIVTEILQDILKP